MAYESWESLIKLSHAAKYGTTKIPFTVREFWCLIAADVLVAAAKIHDGCYG